MNLKAQYFLLGYLDKTAGEYGCIMADLNKEYTDKIQTWISKNIDKADILETEDRSHITILYGIHTQNVNRVREVIKEYAKPISVKLGAISIFSQEDKDVLKLDVEDPDLRKVREDIKSHLRNTQTFDQYVPHVTLVYLKKGKGKKYLGKTIKDITETEIKLDKFVFSNTDYEYADCKI